MHHDITCGCASSQPAMVTLQRVPMHIAHAIILYLLLNFHCLSLFSQHNPVKLTIVTVVSLFLIMTNNVEQSKVS